MAFGIHTGPESPFGIGYPAEAETAQIRIGQNGSDDFCDIHLETNHTVDGQFVVTELGRERLIRPKHPCDGVAHCESIDIAGLEAPALQNRSLPVVAPFADDRRIGIIGINTVDRAVGRICVHLDDKVLSGPGCRGFFGEDHVVEIETQRGRGDSVGLGRDIPQRFQCKLGNGPARLSIAIADRELGADIWFGQCAAMSNGEARDLITVVVDQRSHGRTWIVIDECDRQAMDRARSHGTNKCIHNT